MQKPARYIVFKPTGCRSHPKDWRSKFDTEPLEIVFFGLIGSLIEDDSVNNPIFMDYQRSTKNDSKLPKSNIGLLIETNTGTHEKPEF